MAQDARDPHGRDLQRVRRCAAGHARGGVRLRCDHRTEEALSEGFYDAHYVAAKGAIFGLTKSLAVEFARERGDVRFSWADRLAEAVLRDDQ